MQKNFYRVLCGSLGALALYYVYAEYSDTSVLYLFPGLLIVLAVFNWETFWFVALCELLPFLLLIGSYMSGDFENRSDGGWIRLFDNTQTLPLELTLISYVGIGALIVRLLWLRYKGKGIV